MTRLASWQFVALSVAAVGAGALIIARAGSELESTPAVLDVAVIPWGDPVLVDGDAMAVIGPAWCFGARKEGGSWRQGSTGSLLAGWVVADSETNAASLLIHLDREQLTNDLRMDLTFAAEAGAVLSVNLEDGSGAAVGDSPVSNLVVAANEAAVLSVVLPLRARLAAMSIRVRRTSGGIVVYNTVLAPITSDTAGMTESDQLRGGSTDAPVSADPGDTMATGGISAAGAETVGEGVTQDGAVRPTSSALTNGPAASAPAASVIYVDAALGDDANTGRKAVPRLVPVARSSSGVTGMIEIVDGPKETIRAGLAETMPGDRMVVRSGAYEDGLLAAGRDLRICIEGSVTIRRTNRGGSLSAPPVPNNFESTEGAHIQTNGIGTVEGRR